MGWLRATISVVKAGAVDSSSSRWLSTVKPCNKASVWLALSETVAVVVIPALPISLQMVWECKYLLLQSVDIALKWFRSLSI